MAKALTFEFAGEEFETQFGKVDRSKLYGTKEVEVLDDEGRQCELATLAEDGRTVVGKGGTAMAYLDVDGNWCERTQLRPVDIEGEEIQPVSSSFSAPIRLDQEVDSQTYLNHNIRAIYELDPAGFPAALLDNLRAGSLYQFDFSYRGGLEADAAFLLTNLEGELFMAVGTLTTVQMIGLSHVAPSDETEATSGAAEDLMDFDMI